MGGTRAALTGVPVAMAIGILGSLAATLFIVSIEWLNDRLLGADGPAGPLTVLLAPVAAGLLVGCIIRLVKGQPFVTLVDVIQSSQTRSDRFSSLRMHLYSILASLVSLGGGASVGQYGPLAHIGSCLGYLQWRWTRLLNRRLALASGAAAAIAAAFHAPLAGMVFAQEVIVRNYSFRSFFLIAIASLSSYLFSTHVLAREPFLPIAQMSGFDLQAALFLVLIGIGCGMFAALFIYLTLRLQDLAAASRLAPHWRPAVGGLAAGIVALLTVPDILGVSKMILVRSVSDFNYEMGSALSALAGKLLATVACLGMGFAGSVVSPSLAMGALLGVASGIALDTLPFLSVPMHVWVVCCMFAVTCPAIGATLSGVLIVLELTQNYQLALAALLSIVPANQVMIALLGGSFYDLQLRRRGHRTRPA